MEEKELLDKIEEDLKNENYHNEIEEFVYSRILVIGETVKEHYNVMVSQILQHAIKKLGEIKLIYTNLIFLPIASLHPLFELNSHQVISDTYKAGYLSNIPLYISPYVEERVGYILNSEGEIFKFKLID